MRLVEDGVLDDEGGQWGKRVSDGGLGEDELEAFHVGQSVLG